MFRLDQLSVLINFYVSLKACYGNCLFPCSKMSVNHFELLILTRDGSVFVDSSPGSAEQHIYVNLQPPNAHVFGIL